MFKLSKRALIINAGAGSIVLYGIGALLHQQFARPAFEVCATRYARQVTMQLDRDGIALRPADIQSLANGQDEGVLENLTIAPVQNGPAAFAMGVKVAGGTVAQRAQPGTPGGISLPWIPTVMTQPASACLSYSVYLPSDMDFAAGGTLPGLFATSPTGGFMQAPNVSENLSWQGKGAPKFYIESQEHDSRKAMAFDAYDRELPRGRWVRVDQEMVLNTPGREDGLLRLWLDGKLATDVKSADLRSDADVAITGVTGNVYFGGSGTNGQAPADATILLSPFELRWN